MQSMDSYTGSLESKQITTSANQQQKATSISTRRAREPKSYLNSGLITKTENEEYVLIARCTILALKLSKGGKLKVTYQKWAEWFVSRNKRFLDMDFLRKVLAKLEQLQKGDTNESKAE